MARAKAIPHCKIVPARLVKTGMMIHVPMRRVIVNKQERLRFHSVEGHSTLGNGSIRIWNANGLSGFGRALTLKPNQLLLVRITERAPRRSKTK